MRDVEIIDATPAMADGVIPQPYQDRDPAALSRLGWLKAAPVFARLPKLAWGEWTVTGEGREIEESRRDCPELVAAGCATVFAYGAEDGTAATVVGVNEDGTRAAVLRFPKAEGK
jgi:hypothetical protein